MYSDNKAFCSLPPSPPSLGGSLGPVLVDFLDLGDVKFDFKLSITFISVIPKLLTRLFTLFMVL